MRKINVKKWSKLLELLLWKLLEAGINREC
jgi:hypothetical protein